MSAICENKFFVYCEICRTALAKKLMNQNKFILLHLGGTFKENSKCGLNFEFLFCIKLNLSEVFLLSFKLFKKKTI